MASEKSRPNKKKHDPSDLLKLRYTSPLYVPLLQERAQLFRTNSALLQTGSISAVTKFDTLKRWTAIMRQMSTFIKKGHDSAIVKYRLKEYFGMSSMNKDCDELKRLRADFNKMNFQNVHWSSICANINLLTEQSYTKSEIREVIFILVHSHSRIKANIKSAQQMALPDRRTELNVALYLVEKEVYFKPEISPNVSHSP